MTDLTLEALSKLNSLKILRIKGCTGLTNEGISKIIVKLPNLNYLDARCLHQVDNRTLDTALSIQNRHIYILCDDTRVDPVKFEYKYENAKKDLIDRNYFKFEYKNLVFEASMKNKIMGSGAWKNEYNSDEENCWNFEYSPNDDNFYDEDDEDFDFDDWINNEKQEMYEELDTY